MRCCLLACPPSLSTSTCSWLVIARWSLSILVHCSLFVLLVVCYSAFNARRSLAFGVSCCLCLFTCVVSSPVCWFYCCRSFVQRRPAFHVPFCLALPLSLSLIFHVKSQGSTTAQSCSTLSSWPLDDLLPCIIGGRQ